MLSYEEKKKKSGVPELLNVFCLLSSFDKLVKIKIKINKNCLREITTSKTSKYSLESGSPFQTAHGGDSNSLTLFSKKKKKKNKTIN